MSTLNDGTGIAVETTAGGQTDSEEQQAANPPTASDPDSSGLNPELPGQNPPRGGMAGGLPGLAGFAQIDAYALQKPAPEPEPSPNIPEIPLETYGTPVMPYEEPAAPVMEEETLSPVAFPDEPPASEPAFDGPRFPEDHAPQLDSNWSLSNQDDMPVADDLSSESLPDSGGMTEPDLQQAVDDDDFGAFSKDSLERFLAGDDTLAVDETVAPVPLDDGAFAPQPGDGAAGQDVSPSQYVGEEGIAPSPDHQAFEGQFDQPFEASVGDFHNEDGEPAQPYFAQQGDADFLDEKSAAPGAVTGKRSKRLVVVASALVGSLALGGVLAFAYKNSGEIFGGSGETPLIQADNRLVKQTPDEPGGKQFPHQNKLIYDRLQGEETPEVEHVVPRQEEVAASADEPADSGPQTAQPSVVAEGPKKVKTLVVRPDGTVMEAPQNQTASTTPMPSELALGVPSLPSIPQIPMPEAIPPSQQEPALASVEAPVRKPDPAAVASRTAAAPATRPIADSASGQYVVQVAARKSQTDALAAFADLQQKYPSLLNNYRPLIERADLGSKGIWYRLRVGPLNQKTSAAKLCQKLKSAGMSSCLVRPHTGS